MKRVMRKSILIGVAVTLFSLFGMAANSMAATITLPDPQTYVTNPADVALLQGHQFVAWAHDDFWSYSARLIQNDQAGGGTAFPIATYGDYAKFDKGAGLGTLGLIVETNNGFNNPTPFPDAISQTGQASEFHDVWGVPGATSAAALTFFNNSGYPSNLITPTFTADQSNPSSTAGVTVADLKTWLNGAMPVFGLIDANNQSSTGLQKEFSGRVYLANADGSVAMKNGLPLLWAFDIKPQPVEGVNPLRLTTSGPGGDVDYPGFTTRGMYDPTDYATIQAFAGGGNIDYLTYSPDLNLNLYDPSLSGLYFITDFTIKNPALDKQGNPVNVGNTTVFLTNQIAVPAVPAVPEPGTLLLLGLGLVGLAGVRRKFQK